MTDAAHLLTDFASFLISLFSLWVSSRPATKIMNFGWFRAEILGALLSVLSIWVVTGVLVYLAVQRIVSDDFSIDGEVMLITAACAVGVNIIMAVTLHQPGSFHGHSHGGGGGGHSHSHGHGHGHGGGKESEQNVNVRAAFIHVLGDLLQSLGVLIAAIIIYFKPNLKIADPICTFIFSVIVLATTISILRDVLRVLMEGTPKGIDFNEVKASLLAVPGVRDLHSLHLWALTMNQPVLSVHIAIEESVDPHLVLSEATIALHKKFGFYTTTIQVERYMDEMKNCTDCQDPSD
ncbi:proton-coupled zinc antiporter SLC30A2 [Lampetra planeri]